MLDGPGDGDGDAGLDGYAVTYPPLEHRIERGDWYSRAEWGGDGR
jgi:hypothetical protein